MDDKYVSHGSTKKSGQGGGVSGGEGGGSGDGGDNAPSGIPKRNMTSPESDKTFENEIGQWVHDSGQNTAFMANHCNEQQLQSFMQKKHDPRCVVMITPPGTSCHDDL